MEKMELLTQDQINIYHNAEKVLENIEDILDKAGFELRIEGENLFLISDNESNIFRLDDTSIGVKDKNFRSCVSLPRSTDSQELVVQKLSGEFKNYKTIGLNVHYSINELRGLLFESMIHDSINLRQKLLWTNTESDLLAAGEDQIKSFEENIDARREEDYIIEEYKGHLEQFKEWFEIFKLDLRLISALRNGSGSFTDNDYNFIDSYTWILRDN